MDFLKRRRALLAGKKFLCTLRTELCRDGESDGYSGIAYVKDKDGNEYSGEGENFSFSANDTLAICFNTQSIYSGKIIFFGETVEDGEGNFIFEFSADCDIAVSQRDAEEDGYKYIVEVERV